MNKKTAVIILALAISLVACKSGEVTNVAETYTVTTPVWSHTNVVEISRCSDLCTLIRYVEGETNGLKSYGVFHAFGVPVTIETNTVKISQPVDAKWPTLKVSVTNNGQWNYSPLKIEWMNDAVYYTTNQVFYEERTQAITNRSVAYFYTKDVVSTNKVGPWFFGKGNGQVEIGFRDDGVVVWRNRK